MYIILLSANIYICIVTKQQHHRYKHMGHGYSDTSPLLKNLTKPLKM